MPAPPDLFRAEAIAALEAPVAKGAPLALLPMWTGAAYWFVVLMVGAAVLFAALASVGEYAEGPAVVRVDGRLDLTAPTGGLVLTVEARAGLAVKRGQRLVQLHSQAEQQQLDQLQREIDLRLVRLLTHPAEEATRQALVTLRAESEQAEARLRMRALVAPRSGVVRNLRVRPGQMLNPGDPVLSLVDERPASYEVVALVPGHFRPLLRRGQPMRFALEGYPQVHETLLVESVSDEAVGPSEARRALGPELADTLPVQGSLVLVRGRLPGPTFGFQGGWYRYFDGLPGRVDVRVRSLRVALMVFPPLGELLGHGS